MGVGGGVGLRRPLAAAEPLQTNSNAAINTEQPFAPNIPVWKDATVSGNRNPIKKGKETVTFARFRLIFAVYASYCSHISKRIAATFNFEGCDFLFALA